MPHLRKLTALGFLLLAPLWAHAQDTASSSAPAHGASISSAALDSTAGGISRAEWMAAKPVLSRHAMVVSDQHYATEAGLQILKEGGNAVDAAVAVGYAQAVVNP